MDTRDRRKLLLALAEAQNWRCAYCFVDMDMVAYRYGGRRGREASLDHVVPRLRKGATGRSNCVAACAECNVARGHLDAEWFAAEVLRIGRNAAHQRAIRIIARMNRDRDRGRAKAGKRGKTIALGHCSP